MGTENEWLSQGRILSPAFWMWLLQWIVCLGHLVDLRTWMKPLTQPA